MAPRVSFRSAAKDQGTCAQTMRDVQIGGAAVERVEGARGRGEESGREGVIGSLEVAFRVDCGDLGGLTRRKPPGGGPSGG